MCVLLVAAMLAAVVGALSASGSPPEVSAASAGTKPVGEATYVWGSAPSSPGARVFTQVQLNGSWVTSQISTANQTGAYVLELTYGRTTPGAYRWRVGVQTPLGARYSDEFTLTRTFRVTAGSAGSKAVGQETFVWGSAVPGAVVQTEVQVGGRWAASQRAIADRNGSYALPLTYGRTTPGTYRWRVTAKAGGETASSSEFTLIRYGECTVAVLGKSVRIPASSSTATVVSSSGSRATVAMVRRHSACSFTTVFTDSTGRVGYAGTIAQSQRKQDSGKTPAGTFTITEAFGLQPNPGTRLAWRKPDSGSYWVLDPGSSYYNQWRQSSQGGFRRSGGERLMDFPGQYDYAAVINYNRSPAVKGKGGAIFLHVNGAGATAGCVSISKPNMKRFLATVVPGDQIHIF